MSVQQSNSKPQVEPVSSCPNAFFPAEAASIRENIIHHLMSFQGRDPERPDNADIYKTFAYTNHTLMPEALEKQTVELLGRVLPRHLEIIYEINKRFLGLIAKSYPGKFNAKMNGITPRRWLLLCNQRLAELVSSHIGKGWITDLTKLRAIESRVDDDRFCAEWRKIKFENKVKLTEYIMEKCGVTVNLASMFDVQVQRIHEYKRQLLNVLHVIHLYQKIVRLPDSDIAPRTFIFAGKAAPSYWKAKLIIKLITSIAAVINKDPRIGGKLKVAFLPNYNLSQTELIIPAADLSEQISTAGTEASGTGDMKFSLNGALTIGTLDDANIEIREEVGEESIFIFGMDAEEAEYERLIPSRSPAEVCKQMSDIGEVIEAIRNGSFSGGSKDLFKPLVDSLLDRNDPYLVMLDFESYIACQERVSKAFLSPESWTRTAILNVARMGKFSTDRTIRQYAEEIWGVPVDGERGK